jgi:hypothetical protein
MTSRTDFERAPIGISSLGRWQPWFMRVSVVFLWQELGPLTLDLSQIRFPEMPAVPSIYRFDPETGSMSAKPTS